MHSILYEAVIHHDECMQVKCLVPTGEAKPIDHPQYEKNKVLFFIENDRNIPRDLKMNLMYLKNSRLPRLAWLAEVNHAKQAVSVQHGDSVECCEHFFIEGVWNGDFSSGDFSSTDCIFGTGGVIQKDSVIFVSSASTTDYLYYTSNDLGQLSIANSLPLLLASMNDSLDPSFLGYNGINDTIAWGIDAYIQEIPTRKSVVKRLMYRNLYIGGSALQEVEKNMPPHFPSYSLYHEYIEANFERIVKNARDYHRTTRVEICSTQSKGYDSTAVNAIAAKFGIDKVFTILKGKSPSHFATNDAHEQVDDDGREICRILKVASIPIERHAFETDFPKEYFYHASLHRNQDMNFKEIEKYISPVSLLLTGSLGEMWYGKKNYENRPGFINDQLKRWDLASCGLSEVRLVIGFIQVPLIYIGARRREDIISITESEEMAPWRLGTNYDRPIPRRIAEEAGVPREAFGQVKVASAVIFPMPYLPVGANLRKEFFEFLVQENMQSKWEIWFWPLVLYVNACLAFRYSRFKWLYYLERGLSKVLRRKVEFRPLWSHLKGAVYVFGVNKCVREYEDNLKYAK